MLRYSIEKNAKIPIKNSELKYILSQPINMPIIPIAKPPPPGHLNFVDNVEDAIDVPIPKYSINTEIISPIVGLCNGLGL